MEAAAYNIAEWRPVVYASLGNRHESDINITQHVWPTGKYKFFMYATSNITNNRNINILVTCNVVKQSCIFLLKYIPLITLQQTAITDDLIENLRGHQSVSWTDHCH